MLIGAHLSVADGYLATVDYAEEVGAECLQIFAKSPRQWRAKPTDPKRASVLRGLLAERGVGPLFTHTAYLINLSTNDPELRAKSIAALADELDRGALLGATGIVTHVGNDPLEDPSEAAGRASEAIEAAFTRMDGDLGQGRLLLENTAGAGRTFGSSFEQLGAILGNLGSDTRQRVGVCLDTCHAHAYGIDLSGPEQWETLIDEVEACCGTETLGLIHANDCLYERGTRRDRHAWIGDGYLGTGAFAAMVCADRLSTVPAITEMPGEIPEKDMVNVARLKELRDACR